MEKSSHRLAFVEDDNAGITGAISGRGFRARRAGRTGGKGREVVGNHGNKHGVSHGVGDRNGRGRIQGAGAGG